MILKYANSSFHRSHIDIDIAIRTTLALTQEGEEPNFTFVRFISWCLSYSLSRYRSSCLLDGWYRRVSLGKVTLSVRCPSG